MNPCRPRSCGSARIPCHASSPCLLRDCLAHFLLLSPCRLLDHIQAHLHPRLSITGKLFCGLLGRRRGLLRLLPCARRAPGQRAGTTRPLSLGPSVGHTAVLGAPKWGTPGLRVTGARRTLHPRGPPRRCPPTGVDIVRIRAYGGCSTRWAWASSSASVRHASRRPSAALPGHCYVKVGFLGKVVEGKEVRVVLNHLSSLLPRTC